MNEMAVCVLVGCWGGLQDFGACGPKMLVSCPDYKWFILCMCTKTNTHTHTICTHPCRRSFPWQTHPHCVSVVLFPSQWYWPSGTPTGPQTRNKLVTTTKDTQTHKHKGLCYFSHTSKSSLMPRRTTKTIFFVCLFNDPYSLWSKHASAKVNATAANIVHVRLELDNIDRIEISQYVRLNTSTSIRSSKTCQYFTMMNNHQNPRHHVQAQITVLKLYNSPWSASC